MKICVFCGSASGKQPRYMQQASYVGTAIAQHGWTLVYGGGNTGLMGSVANAALQAQGQVIGIMPHLLIERERALMSVTEFETVPDMATRKQRMIDLSDAFVILPGGMGTLDELFEVLTWYQLGIHTKPSFILNSNGFYDPLLAQIQHMQAEGFLYYEAPIEIATDPESLIQKIQARFA